jgi:hypothetical protein
MMGSMIKGVLIFFIIVIVIGGLSWGGAYIYRYKKAIELDSERHAIKHSIQYREGKTSQLMQLAQEWNDADEGQKKFLFSRIQIEAERVGVENTPQIIQEILRGNK